MVGIDVGLGRYDVVVARQNDWSAAFLEGLSVTDQGLEPSQLIVELWTRDRIAVGQVEASDQDAVHRGLDIAGLAWVRIAGKSGAGDDGS